MKNFIRGLLPYSVLDTYHHALALWGALRWGFPSSKLLVIGITGTKGKSSTSELVASILTSAGYKVALASTIRFAIEDMSEPNLFKMTMPGHGYLQQFMRRALNAGCSHVVIEMTSEGAVQFRHKGIELDALIFTNLQPEHIERHGSFEAYAAAKLLLAKHLEESRKRPRYIVANADDAYGAKFMDIDVEVKAPFSLRNAEPYKADDTSVRFVWHGELYTVPLPGLFNLYNVLAAMTLADAMQLPRVAIRRAVEHQAPIAGRAERVVGSQPYSVVVDYAHTPDSLKALYEAYKEHRIIGVLGSTGGGRDTWKRAEMGKIADEYCDVAILTNEDPYDENPQKIVDDLAKGFSNKKPHVIMDRRSAIKEALREAKSSDVVLITGKGTDPYIMGPNGTKEAWSDRRVAQEELAKLGFKVEGIGEK